MNQTQALAKLKKLLGPKVGYRINAKAPTADERQAAREGLESLQLEAAAADRAREARLAELLANDADYQRLKAETLAAKRALVDARATVNCYRITVGVSGSMFFSVMAEGDHWDEVVGIVAAKHKDAA